MIIEVKSPKEIVSCFRCEQTIVPPYIKRSGTVIITGEGTIHSGHLNICGECAIKEADELKNDIKNLKQEK